MLRGIATASLSSTRGGLRPGGAGCAAAGASIGGLRSVRQQAGGGRGGRDSREVAEFLEDAMSPGGGGANRGGRGAGRGSGSYERFIKAHKDTVLSEEDRRFKTWSSWRESMRDDDDEDLDDEELTSEEQGYLGQMSEAEEDAEGGRRDGGRRGRRGRRDDAADETGSYFDWGDEGIFIPRLPERTDDAGFTSDRVLPDDDLPLRVNKLLWRRVRIKARDMDQHVPVAWRRSKALREAMAAARRREAGSEDSERVASGGAEGEAGATRAEVKRLNAAQTVEAIEAELGRLIVEGKLDQQLAMGAGGGRPLDGSRVAESRERQGKTKRVSSEGTDGSSCSNSSSSSNEEEGGENDDDDGERGEEEEDDDDEEDEFAHLDEWSRIHAQDLEEALGDEIPTMDRQEEGFEAFREYAEQLIEAGGVIEYRFTTADQLDREVRLPLPLATKRTLRTSLEKDRDALGKVTHTQLAAAAAAAATTGGGPQGGKAHYDVAQAFAWLALNKNPGIGETQRKELSEAVAASLQRLQEKPNRLERMRARAQGGGAGGGGSGSGSGGGGGGGGGGAKGKAAAKGGGQGQAKAKAKAK